MTKHIKTAIVLIFVTSLLMICGIMQNSYYSKIVSRGNYFFEKTRQSLSIRTLVLRFANNKQITIEQKNHIWHIKEADDYYADFQKINSLIRLIRNITIYRADNLKQPLSADMLKDAFLIQSLDTEGNIVDSAQILPKKDKNKYHYALLNNKPLLYQLSGDIALSSLVLDWVKMPILSIAHNQIKRIKTDDFSVYRRFSAEELMREGQQYSVPQIKTLTNNFWDLSAIDIKHALHFDRTQYTLAKSFEITMLDGMIYNIDVFTKDDEYWLNIRLDKEKIVEPDVLIQLKENNILYEGWFFKINSSTGLAIVNFVL